MNLFLKIPRERQINPPGWRREQLPALKGSICHYLGGHSGVGVSLVRANSATQLQVWNPEVRLFFGVGAVTEKFLVAVRMCRKKAGLSMMACH